MFTKTLTRSGSDDDSYPVGKGFYYIDNDKERHAKLVSARCYTTFIENSKYKRRTVFYDRDGKPVATGWMMW